MTKRKAAKKIQNPDPFYVELPPDVEDLGQGFPTVQEYLDQWRERLAKLKPDNPKHAIVPEALHYISLIEMSNHPTVVLESAVRLGQCFERIDFAPLVAKTKATKLARQKRLDEANEKKREIYDKLRTESNRRMVVEVPLSTSENQAAKKVAEAFKHLEVKPTVRSIKAW